MWKPASSFAVTLKETVSPGLASAGSTVAVRVACVGLRPTAVSFLAGLGASSAVAEAGMVNELASIPAAITGSTNVRLRPFDRCMVRPFEKERVRLNERG